MNKFFLISAFLSWASMAQAEVITLTPSGGGTGGGTLTSGTTPVSGCSPGQFLYNNSGLLGCQSGSGGGMSINGSVTGGTAGQGLYVAAGSVLAQFAYGAGVFTAMQVAADTTGGVVLLNGTPTSGDLLQWSATGAQDSNVAASSVVTLGATQTLTNKTLTSPAFTGTVTGAGTIPVGVISATGTPSSTTFLRGDGTWNAVSGGIAGPGTTVVGDLVTWNSTTGAAIADSGFSISGGTLTGPATLSLTLLGASGHGLLFGSNGGANWTIPYNSSNLYPATDNVSQLGLATNRVSSGFFVNLGSTAAGINNIYLQGLSTGTDLLQSGNSSTTSRTITIPAGTANDTLALLGASQTFSGNDIHSGSVLFTGAPTTFTGNNQTTIQGGTTVPNFGSYTGAIAIGGNYNGATLSAGGQGAIFMNGTAYGLTIQGDGTSYDSCLANYVGSCIITVKHGSTGALISGAIYYASNHLYSSNTAPTFSGATAGTSNGTLAFTFVPTASGASVTITMPSANTGWVCQFTDLTTPAQQVRQTGVLSATSVTASAFTWAGATGAFGTSDTVTAMCAAI